MVNYLSAASNLTDSGRRKYNYFLLNITAECLIPFIDRKYVFVFYKMCCYYIPVNCISVNLINKTETNKAYLIKTIIIDTH